MTDLLPDLRQLRAFVAVADEGSFTLAAKKLFLTQSAISHSMKALEDSLGCRLLERLGKKTILTEEGEVFLRRCRRVLGELEDASRELDGLKRWGQGRIRIGAPQAICQFLLPTVLREFRDCFPRCEPSLESDDTPRLLERMSDHELDVVLGLSTRQAQADSCRTLFRDRMTFIVPPDHHWAETGVADIAELTKTQFIIYARAIETHKLLEEHFDQLGVRPRPHQVLGDMETIKGMVKVGLGVGIVAPWVAKKEFDDGSLVAVAMPGPPIEREWGIFHNGDRQLSLIEETFAGIAEMVGRELYLADN